MTEIGDRLGDCGAPFEVGGEYLVYADGSDGRYSGSAFRTDLCIRARLVEYAEQELLHFGDPQRPA